jgi:5-methyltetrahydrofolate--homocysteine methyltransferase
VRADELRAVLNEGPLLLDGAMGTMLMAAGLAPGQAPEKWVLERPEAVAAVHRAYASSGADVLLTCTFGGSPPKLAAAGLPGRCAEANRHAVGLAREAAGAALVAGDIGPTGLLLPPVGTASEAELAAAFAEQVEALVGAGVDLLLIETMFDLREAMAAVEAAVPSGVAVLAAMTFEARRRGAFTVMGDPLAGSLAALAAAGAAAVGCNCSVTAPAMAEMIRVARETVEAPLLAEPNAGQPHVGSEGTTYDERPESFAAGLASLVAAGASLVGGCCGTTPDHIRAARAALDASRR